MTTPKANIERQYVQPDASSDRGQHNNAQENNSGITPRPKVPRLSIVHHVLGRCAELGVALDHLVDGVQKVLLGHGLEQETSLAREQAYWEDENAKTQNTRGGGRRC